MVCREGEKMFGFIGGALAGLGLGFGRSALQHYWNRRAASEDFDRNANLSWQMWNANNAYNHPRAQMERFREAGLNPNLVYGQMSQAPMPAMVKSTTSPSDFEWNLGELQSLENGQLNNDLTRAEISNKLQQRRINDVAMDSTRAATELAKQRLSIEALQSRDAHKESVLRQSVLSNQVGDLDSTQNFWDSIYDSFGGKKTDRGRGAPLKSSASFVGGLLKQAIPFLIKKHPYVMLGRRIFNK